MADEKIKNSSELEFAVFCIENVAAKLGVDAECVYQAFTEQSDILNGYIVPEYEVLHTQSREYIVDDLLDVMKERGVWKYDSLSWFFLRNCKARFGSFLPQCRLRAWFFDGLIDKTEAINRLRYEKPNLQICFRTEKALSLLRFEGSETL